MRSVVSGFFLARLLGVGLGISDIALGESQGTVVNWGYRDTNFGWSLKPPVLMTAIWGGMDLHVGRDSTGAIWRWGDNQPPQQLLEIGACSKAAPGYYHIVALRSDGSVRCWGSDYFGSCLVPPDLGPCIDVAATWEGSFAIRTSGQVIGWGPIDGFKLSPPTDLSTCAQIAARARGAGAIRQNGTIRLWGEREFPGYFQSSSYTKLSIGDDFAIALRADGVVEAAGSNLPANLGRCSDIAAGSYHAVALQLDGTVRTWGFVQAEGSALPPPAGIRNVMAVAASRRSWSVLEYICPPDLDWNHSIDAGDIGVLLLDFGTSSADSDLDGSGEVDTGDIGVLLLEFGQCSGQPTAPTPTPLTDEPSQKPVHR